jgi:hypothetical protein
MRARRSGRPRRLVANDLAKAFAVTKAAERDRRIFGDLVAKMDETGRVHRAYQEMRARQGKLLPVRVRQKRHPLIELAALSIDDAKAEITDLRMRIKFLEGLIAKASALMEPPRARRLLNVLPDRAIAEVLVSVQNKQEL